MVSSPAPPSTYSAPEYSSSVCRLIVSSPSPALMRSDALGAAKVWLSKVPLSAWSVSCPLAGPSISVIWSLEAEALSTRLTALLLSVIGSSPRYSIVVSPSCTKPESGPVAVYCTVSALPPAITMLSKPPGPPSR